MKASENVKQELFTKKKNGETETKKAIDYLTMPKLQEIFTTVAIMCLRCFAKQWIAFFARSDWLLNQ